MELFNKHMKNESKINFYDKFSIKLYFTYNFSKNLGSLAFQKAKDAKYLVISVPQIRTFLCVIFYNTIKAFSVKTFKWKPLKSSLRRFFNLKFS